MLPQAAKFGPLACALWLAVAVPALAAEKSEDSVDVSFEGGRYTLVIHRYIDAPVLAVFGVITDYENLGDVDEHILESRRLEQRSDDTHVVYTRVRDCLAVFCRTVERVEEVVEHSIYEIVSTADPERSDVSYSVNTWSLNHEGEGTRLHYQLEMEPKFWVPKLGGRSALKRKLAKNTAKALESLEALARVRANGGLSP